jgi:hypothetical protein
VPIELLNPAAVTAAMFAPFEGQDFLFLSGELQLRLTLFEVGRNKKDGIGQRTPFSLLFTGPGDSSFLQGIGRLSAPRFGELEIFVTRVMPPPSACQGMAQQPAANPAGPGYYEAVFG